ncbi:uncharacterized protein LOC126611956 [Malus sylvestris]|uniref:uncharacterized protein LOC126611956 n=1 Tax=Malus sylvestris TaxID=3752 RepID=UPI0021ABD713|nr:uncharacterized protein LOC126611956 [Malus sylvestris]
MLPSSSSSFGSNSSASTSNPHSHDHIPAITAGTIITVPYDSPPPPPQFQQPYYPPSQSLSESYGYGFSANSTGQNAPRSQSSNDQFASNGNNYRGGNNYRNNNGFRGMGYNSGNSTNYYSGGSRQASNGNGTWSGNVDTRTTMVIECQICNKREHIAVNYFHRNTNAPTTGFVVECQICGKKGHFALDCLSKRKLCISRIRRQGR